MAAYEGHFKVVSNTTAPDGNVARIVLAPVILDTNIAGGSRAIPDTGPSGNVALDFYIANVNLAPEAMRGKLNASTLALMTPGSDVYITFSPTV